MTKEVRGARRLSISRDDLEVVTEAAAQISALAVAEECRPVQVKRVDHYAGRAGCRPARRRQLMDGGGRVGLPRVRIADVYPLRVERRVWINDNAQLGGGGREWQQRCIAELEVVDPTQGRVLAACVSAPP